MKWINRVKGLLRDFKGFPGFWILRDHFKGLLRDYFKGFQLEDFKGLFLVYVNYTRPK